MKTTRRSFTAGALALAAAPFSARAQAPGGMYRIAIVENSEPPINMIENGAATYRAFFGELRRLGYVEGNNLLVERWSADGRPERMAEIARTAAARGPDAILARGERPTLVLQAATNMIPIVSIVADPVARAIVPSLARPGGNVTGIAIDAGAETLPTKRVQFIREMAPQIKSLAYLTAGAVANTAAINDVRKAAESLGLSFAVVSLASPINEAEYQRRFAAELAGRVDAITVSTATENNTFVRTIVGLAAEARMPTIYPWREGPDAGGLISYGASYVDFYRQAAQYMDRILRGAKPSDLPFIQPSRFELVVNVKTARALGLTIPETIFLRATEVIE